MHLASILISNVLLIAISGTEGYVRRKHLGYSKLLKHNQEPSIMDFLQIPYPCLRSTKKSVCNFINALRPRPNKKHQGIISLQEGDLMSELPTLTIKNYVKTELRIPINMALDCFKPKTQTISIFGEGSDESLEPMTNEDELLSQEEIDADRSESMEEEIESDEPVQHKTEINESLEPDTCIDELSSEIEHENENMEPEKWIENNENGSQDNSEEIICDDDLETDNEPIETLAENNDNVEDVDQEIPKNLNSDDQKLEEEDQESDPDIEEIEKEISQETIENNNSGSPEIDELNYDGGVLIKSSETEEDNPGSDEDDKTLTSVETQNYDDYIMDEHENCGCLGDDVLDYDVQEIKNKEIQPEDVTNEEMIDRDSFSENHNIDEVVDEETPKTLDYDVLENEEMKPISGGELEENDSEAAPAIDSELKATDSIEIVEKDNNDDNVEEPKDCVCIDSNDVLEMDNNKNHQNEQETIKEDITNDEMIDGVPYKDDIDKVVDEGAPEKLDYDIFEIETAPPTSEKEEINFEALSESDHEIEEESQGWVTTRPMTKQPCEKHKKISSRRNSSGSAHEDTTKTRTKRSKLGNPSDPNFLANLMKNAKVSSPGDIGKTITPMQPIPVSEITPSSAKLKESAKLSPSDDTAKTRTKRNKLGNPSDPNFLANLMKNAKVSSPGDIGKTITPMQPIPVSEITPSSARPKESAKLSPSDDTAKN